MDFDWSPLPLKDWQALMAQAPRSNLLQSWPYARAMRMKNQVMTRPATIRRGREIMGLFQVQEVGLGPVHIVHLHRGPVWFDAKPAAADWHDFLSLFNARFPARLGRLRRVMPDRPHGPETHEVMAGFGFRPKGTAYETIWLDLTPSRDRLRADLHQKWRHALGKAERSGLDVDLDRVGRRADWFLAGYGRDRGARGYRAASPAFLRILMGEAMASGDCWILRAMEGRDPVAGILVLRHGASATYQAGWTTPKGRMLNAHHRLLWAAIMALKEDGYTALDLGGVHPKMAEGVTRFKKGLGGDHCILAGMFA